MREVQGPGCQPDRLGDVPSAGPPLPALPEHDRVLLETADLPRRVLAADPGSSAWIHPTTGSPCAPCRTRHWSPRAWSRQPPQPALTDLKEPRSAGRSTVRDAGARRGSARSIRSSAICEVRSGLLPGSGGPQDVYQRSPCPPAHGAQNAQIWTASVVMGIEPTPAQIGGDARVLLNRGSRAPRPPVLFHSCERQLGNGDGEAAGR